LIARQSTAARWMPMRASIVDRFSWKAAAAAERHPVGVASAALLAVSCRQVPVVLVAVERAVERPSADGAGAVHASQAAARADAFHWPTFPEEAAAVVVHARPSAAAARACPLVAVAVAVEPWALATLRESEELAAMAGAVAWARCHRDSSSA